ncbi:MAG: hypothetical protein ACLP1X_33725 [Polyangiaceae bacterium]
MNLQEYMRLVVESDTRAWNVITCWGAGSGPSYRDKFEIATVSGAQQVTRWELRVDSHGMSAALRADLAVTLAWGLKSNENFHEEWANQFSDPHATSSYVDLFYNGALIHRELYVTVDGGRASLPLPERRGERLVAPIGYAHLCRLLVSFETNADDFDHYMTRAGISVVDEPWP